jgi:hypothetical protein
MSPRPILAIVLVALTTSLAASTAQAWGPEGHAIIADIAELRLAAGPEAEVQRLLRLDPGKPTGLADVASWPDQMRWTHPETATWHFVNIPLAATSYRPERDCIGGNCVVDAIERFSRNLADRRRPDHERLEALKWVVHLVGDIHEPIHCANNDDRRGNELHLTYLGIDTDLHHVWDTSIVEVQYHWQLGITSGGGRETIHQVALELGLGITDRDKREIVPDGLLSALDRYVVDWANQSHAAAQRVVYGALPAAPRPTGWDQLYQEKSWPVAKTQLAQAGIRLAELLNEALK